MARGEHPVPLGGACRACQYVRAREKPARPTSASRNSERAAPARAGTGYVALTGDGVYTRLRERHGQALAQYDQLFFREQAEGSEQSARHVLTRLFEHVRPGSILDIGCGVGTWLKAATDLGVADVLGIDGADAASEFLRIPEAAFLKRDLSEPLDLGRRFDLVMSLEVAEHLPANRAPVFVRNLVRHGDLIMFSAALPYQGGDGHLNENWLEFWAPLFAGEGYDCVDALRGPMWHDARVDWWYRQNTVLFRNAAARDRVLPHLEGTEARSLPHPEFVLRAMRRTRSPTLRTTLETDLEAWAAPQDTAVGYGPEFDRQARRGAAPAPAPAEADPAPPPPRPLPAGVRAAPPLEPSPLAPDFLCVGMPDAVTTGLFHLLRQHPEAFVAPLLGVNFFNRRVWPHGTAWVGSDTPARAADALRDYLRRIARPNARWVRVLALLLEEEVSQDWYGSVFSDWGVGRRRGDVSPDYCMLPEVEIGQILALNPGVRIVLLLRDPATRALFELRSDLGRTPTAADIDARLAADPAFAARSRCDAIVAPWRTLVPAEQLFLARCEEAEAAPADFAARLAAFVGLDPAAFPAGLPLAWCPTPPSDAFGEGAFDAACRAFAPSRAFLDDILPLKT